MRSFADYSPEFMRAGRSMKWSVPADLAGLQAPELWGHWVAEMDFQPCPEVLQTLRAAVDAGFMGYPPEWLLQDLKLATAEFFAQRFAWEFDPAYVHPACSVLDAFRAFLHLLPPGSEVLVPTPAYMPFLSIPQQVGHSVRQVPAVVSQSGHELSWELDFAGIEAAAQAGARGLVLCNPWNPPTGRAFSRAELQRVSQLAQEYGFLVFADEIHAPLVLPGSAHIPYLSVDAKNRHHTVAASAASKGFNIPGLHCAQAFVSPDSALFAAWQQHAHLLGWPSPLGGLATITAFLQGGAWLDEVCEYIAGTLNMVDELLAQQGGLVSWQRPQAGYLGFLQFPAEFSSVSEGGLARLLYKETGVLTNSGETLGAAYTNFVRFNFSSSQATILDSMSRLLAVLT